MTRIVTGLLSPTHSPLRNLSVTLAGMGRAKASVDVFHAVADPTRRAILDRLRAGAAPVGDLASGFDVSRPAISKHLKVLRDASLVTEQRDGRQRLYAINPAPLRDVAAWIEGYRAMWQTSLMTLKRRLEGHP